MKREMLAEPVSGIHDVQPRRRPVSRSSFRRRVPACAIVVLGVAALGLTAAGEALAAPKNKAVKRLDTARIVLRDSLAAPDSRVPGDLLDRAQCVGIFPSVLKGAFIFGGRYGKGVVSCRKDEGGWAAPANFRIEGGNFGFQIGGNSTDIVLLFLGRRSMDRLLRTKFTLGVDGAAAAGPVGRSASGQTDTLFGAEILTYSRSRGLFAGVALDGATLRPAHGQNRKLYGWEPRLKDILRGEVEPPDAARPLLELLSEYSPRKREKKKATD